MSKTRNCLCRYLFIMVVLCILNFPFTVRGQEKNSLEELNELSAIVYTQVSWSKHESGALIKTGSMSALISGTLTLDEQQKGVFLFFPGSKGMQAEVNYQNESRHQDTGKLCYKEVGSGSVQVASYPSMTQGHFEFMAFTGPGARAHALQLSGQVDIDSLTKAMTSQENMDHYSFKVGVPIQTIVTDKDGNSTVSIKVIDFTLGVEALRGGAISNSLSWIAKTIRHIDMGYVNFMGMLKYDPPKAKEGDVKYTVRWTFGEVKRPCHIIEGRKIETKINKKLYSNETIKDYYKNKFGKERGKEYDKGIKNIAEHVWAKGFQTAEESEQFIDNLTENDIKWMENNQPSQSPGQDTHPTAENKAELGITYKRGPPCDIEDMTLFGYLGGNKVTMSEFDKNNEWKEERENGYNDVKNEYLEKYGPEVGSALFECMVKHELTHKKQYVQNCFPQTIDEYSKYEMEAYDAEIECLKKFYDKCEGD